MAKNFPYFKFLVAEWMTGNIVFEDFAVQGLFINICALYWQRDGKLTLDDINKRYKNPVELKQLNGSFFTVNEDFISIKFLDEQLLEAGHVSKINSDKGKKSAEKRAAVKQRLTGVQPNSTKKRKEKKSKEELEKELNKRKEEFALTLSPFLEKYGKVMLNEFYKYWTEPNNSKTKFRRDGESTWDIERRLETWAKNEKNFGSKNQIPQTETPVYAGSFFKK